MNKFLIVTLALIASNIAYCQSRYTQDYDLTDLVYNRFTASFEYTGISTNGNEFIFNDKGIGLNGFGLEYLAGISLSTSYAMHIEFGTKFSMGWGSKSNPQGNEMEKFNMNLFRISIPLRYIDGIDITVFYRKTITSDNSWTKVYEETAYCTKYGIFSRI